MAETRGLWRRTSGRTWLWWPDRLIETYAVVRVPPPAPRPDQSAAALATAIRTFLARPDAADVH